MNEEREGQGYASASSLALAFILGGILGASLALLFAPQAGSRTRERIKDLAEDLRGKTTDLAEDLRGKLEDVIERSREVIKEGKSIITSAYQAGKETMQKEREKLESAQS